MAAPRKRNQSLMTITPVEAPAETSVEALPVSAPIEEVVPVINPAPLGKGTATPDRYLKVIAVQNSEGLFGNMRYAIVAGNTYSFPAALSKWLMETGRAK